MWQKQVTTRHLLTHMGGWVGDYFNDFGNGDDALDKNGKRYCQTSADSYRLEKYGHTTIQASTLRHVLSKS